MSVMRLEERIEGCLIGAAAGAELGLAKWVHPERFEASDVAQLERIPLKPADWRIRHPNALHEERTRAWRLDFRALVDLGVQAYRQKNGRVTPEDFGPLVASSKAIAFPSFSLDVLHTTQEVLKEGMNPRLSGMGNAPCGLACAFMPAVGIFHFADPERAYLEGVELASVAQPALGADWAGLCAAAVAAAFEPRASAETVAAAVLRIAHQNNKDLFYDLNGPTLAARSMRDKPDALFRWWMYSACKTGGDRRRNWTAHNPIQYALPMLQAFGDDPARFFTWMLGAQPEGYCQWFAGGHALPAIVGGAAIGALHGPQVFPAALRKWATPFARPWFGLAKVARRRVRAERGIVEVIERAARTPARGAANRRSVLHDKVYGNILAGAIGNAMGSPVEGKFYWEIDREHPGGIRTVLDPKRLESEDDNQMAMLLTETYIQRGGSPVMARHFGRTWRERLNRDHFFVLCMGNAYDMLCRGWDARIAGHWSVVTGSTVMCMEPVGLFNIADPQFASIDALAVSYMYQRGLDALAAANMAATVAEALRPDATVDSVCQAALDTAPTTPLKTFDKRKFRSFRDYLEACLAVADKYDDVLAARKELYDKCLLYHHIDPLELWGFSLAMFKIAKGDVRQAAIGGTNIGRDSDTIAGRAAMLAGTLRGVRNVPKDWVSMFKPETLRRIRTNAGRFADLIVGGKLDVLKARQKVAG